MTDKQIVQLVKLVEPQLCGILIENKICNYKRYPKNKSIKSIINKLDNLSVSEEYKDIIDTDPVDDDFIIKLRDLYPQNSDRKGTKDIIKSKINRFLTNHPQYTPDIIFNVIKSYSEELIYSGKQNILYNLDNIFYKRDVGGEKIPILTLIAKYVQKDTSDDDLVSIDD